MNSGGAHASGGAAGGQTNGSGGALPASGGQTNGSGGALPASGGTGPERDASTDATAPDSGDPGSGGTPASGGSGGGSSGTGGAPPSPCASNPCGPGGTCTPQGSTYTCTCKSGYRASGGTCVDIDECFEATHDCHSSSACSDLEGGFDCVCPVGFAGGTRGIACRPRIAVGSTHTCALLTDGTVKCWGDNSVGQLGDNTRTAHAAPATVPGLTNVAAIDAGGATTCAIVGDGRVKCWGYNADGQIGDNSTVDRLIPVIVPGLTDVIAIDTAWSHTCAARLDGAVRCWGSNSNGQLGASNVGGSVLAPQGIGGITKANGVAVGPTQSCVILKSNGSVQCWGKDRLGDGSVSSSYTPVTAKNLDNVVEIALGGFHACARQASSQVYCWGISDLLGNGDTTTDGNPTLVRSVGSTSLVIGIYSTAVAEASGGVAWWGALTTPAALPGLANVIALSAHGPSICGLHRDGSVSCWTIANSNVSAPTLVSGLKVF